MKEKALPASLELELPTIALIVFCYGSWGLITLVGHHFHPILFVFLIAILTTLYWSLVHEVIHGHPSTSRRFNHALMFLPLGWIFPYGRFRDTHLEHHATGNLTDPFDDPESFYLAQNRWIRKSRVARAILIFNNTLFGRLLIGPIISVSRFFLSELQLLTRPEMRGYLIREWGLHAIGLACVIGFIIAFTQVPLTYYLAANYIGYSILLIRTFLEHQASEDFGERTVIIERCCPIAWLFLFNNLHVVHHSRPGIAWYRLPALYREQREKFVTMNKGYIYKSYAEIIAKYFFVPKEPVPHPFVVDRTPPAGG